MATEAFEQCGRPWLTRVEPPLTFDRWLAARDPLVALAVCDERLPPRHLGAWINALPACQGPRAVQVVIGPEGGLSDAERLALDSVCATRVWLAKSVLRAETAAVAAAVIALGP